MVELLSPVGNFESLKAAVQNGADAVYFGANLFSARAFADNFDLDELKNAIQYAKLRGVKTNLTLNTLLKDSELKTAFNLAKSAYEFGIDAIIVQDLGLATMLIKAFPDLPIHASTQMSIHNLEGVLELEKLGFKRIVLSRELSINEIEYISKNSSCELECFVHGALCISYSGQCLFSSMIGGRSGNRGKCAQSCRLPYELLENDKKIDSGYLLSTKDLCSLDYIPQLILAGVKSFKIEGRMKSSEYVATVTRIYRKYIYLAQKLISINKVDDYFVDEKDKKELMQVFNRGNFSSGHLDIEPNQDLIYKEKPNNMGLFLGIIEKYNQNKGYISLKLNESIEIGDTISLENETGSYTISELMEKGKNIKDTNVGDYVTIGRMKGNIKPGDKVYKISSKNLLKKANDSFNGEFKKVLLDASITIKKGVPISITVTPHGNCYKNRIYENMKIKCLLNDAIPIDAKNRPLDKETIISHISKTNDTPYEFVTINIDLDDNLFLPKISMINELRRLALEKVENYALNNISRFSVRSFNDFNNLNEFENDKFNKNSSYISILLNILNLEFAYNELSKDISNIYIPIKYFANNHYEKIIKFLSDNFNLYIYLPTIIRSNSRNLFSNFILSSLESFSVKGFVISNIGNLKLLENLGIDLSNYDLVGNYTLNVFNEKSIFELKSLGINKFTPSSELDKETLSSLCKFDILPKELICYGNLPLMNMRYCLLGKSNLCYPKCDAKCKNLNAKYYLKDRLNMKFRLLPDNLQTITTVYNSKTLSILPNDFNNVNSYRIDVLDESIDDINNIVNKIKSNERFEGKDYTTGNLKREI